MTTQSDTFRHLRRSSYEEVMNECIARYVEMNPTNDYGEPLDASSMDIRDICRKHYWTLKEFNTETALRQLNDNETNFETITDDILDDRYAWFISATSRD